MFGKLLHILDSVTLIVNDNRLPLFQKDTIGNPLDCSFSLCIKQINIRAQKFLSRFYEETQLPVDLSRGENSLCEFTGKDSLQLVRINCIRFFAGEEPLRSHTGDLSNRVFRRSPVICKLHKLVQRIPTLGTS